METILVDALKRHDITPPEKMFSSGGFIRWGKDNRYYAKEFDDGSGWIFGDWTQDLRECCFKENNRPLTPEEILKHKNIIEKEKVLAKEDQEKRQRDASLEAKKLWETSTLATNNHAYLQTKKIATYGLKQCDSSLLIPLYDIHKTLCSIQFIDEKGNKRFLSGGKKKGCYFPIGKLNRQIIICEGYATGATIHAATNEAVAVAFDAGNIKPVAEAIKQKYHALNIIIAADNDQFTTTNIGIEKAKEAAQLVGCKYVFPEFLDITTKPTDFNDLMILEGFERVKEQIHKESMGEKDLKNEKFGETKPLQREIPEPEPFPLDALGEILGGAAEKMTEIIKAPVAICGQSILAAATLAVQPYANILIDGRIIPISCFFLTIGKTGERKSAVDSAALLPHRNFQEKLTKEYENDIKEWLRNSEAYESAKKSALCTKKSKTYEEKKRALLEIGEPPIKPIEPLMIAEEPTYEGLVSMLKNGQPSIGLFSDEGARFIGGYGMNQDNLLKTAAGLCGMWDGKTINRVRGGDGATALAGRRISFHLMAQPDVAQILLSNNMLMEQGLLSRCLVTWPTSTAGNRKYCEKNLFEQPAFLTYQQKLYEILLKKPSLMSNTQNELCPRQLELSLTAKELWVIYYNDVESNIGEGKLLSPIRGLANKAPEHVLRIAGVLSLVKNIDCTVIEIQEIKSAIKLVNHYMNEALRLFDSNNSDQTLSLTSLLLQWLCNNKKSQISLVEIYQYSISSIRNAKIARDMMKTLVDHGYARPLTDGIIFEGIHRKEAWEINI